MATARITVAQFEKGVAVKIDERTEIVVVPPPLLVTLGGMLFATNKSFLLPVARDQLGVLQEVYAARDTDQLLLVGHTDTSGDPSVNDPLSLERAEKLVAFVKDDPATWLAMFESNIPSTRRWGSTEDFHMIEAILTDGSEATVEAFQLDHNARVQDGETQRDPLTADGLIGPNTRRELILAYMARDGSSLGSGEFAINTTAHGCGENFPLDEAGDDVDAAPAANASDDKDRRVEFFFFPKSTGIDPPAPGSNSPAGSTEYPEWRKKAEVFNLEALRTGRGGVDNSALISFILENDDRTVAANQSVTVAGEKETETLTTDAEGLLEKQEVDPGDYVLTVGELTMTVSALPAGESRVPLLLRQDPPEEA